jgi:hypothetical protein
MSDSACGTSHPIAGTQKSGAPYLSAAARVATRLCWNPRGYGVNLPVAFQTVRKARPLVLLPDYFRVIIREWLNILFGANACGGSGRS